MKRFNEPENLAVFTCTHIIQKGLPILMVSHDKDDGGWQFLCGDKSHGKEHGMIVALDEVILLDEQVNEVADLPKGYIATRKTRKETWYVSKLST